MKKKLIYLALPIMLGSLSIISCGNDENNDNPLIVKRTFNLSIDAPESLKDDLVIAAPDNGEYLFGTSISVSISYSDSTNYAFDGYFVNGTKKTDNLSYTFKLTEDTNLVAKFTQIGSINTKPNFFHKNFEETTIGEVVEVGVLGLWHKNTNEALYFDGYRSNTYYFETDREFENGAIITSTKVSETEVSLKISSGRYKDLYIGGEISGTHNNLTTQEEVFPWTYNISHDAYTAKLSDEIEVFIGNYNAYTNIGLNLIEYLDAPNDNIAHIVQEEITSEEIDVDEGVGNVDIDKNPNKITFWHSFSKTQTVLLEEKVNEFEKLYEKASGTDIKIELEEHPGYETLSNDIISGYINGNTPTLVAAYPSNIAKFLDLENNDEEFVYNLEDLFLDPEIGFDKENEFNPSLKGIEDFLPSYIEENSTYIKEGTYSLPFMKSTEALFYNADLLKEVLKDYLLEEVDDLNAYLNSLTWNDFIDLLHYVNEDKEKYDIDIPLVLDSDSNFFITQSFQRNAPYVSLNNKEVSIDFNNVKTKNMLEDLKACFDDGLFKTYAANGNYSGGGFLSAGWSLFSICSTSSIGWLNSSSFEIGVSKIPSYTKNEEYSKYILQGTSLAMLKNKALSEEVNKSRSKIAWSLMKYLTSEEVNIDLATSFSNYIPVRKSCYTNSNYLSYLNDSNLASRTSKVVVQDIDGDFFSYPVFSGSEEINLEMGKLLNRVLVDKVDIQVALDESIENVKQYL